MKKGRKIITRVLPFRRCHNNVTKINEPFSLDGFLLTVAAPTFSHSLSLKVATLQFTYTMTM